LPFGPRNRQSPWPTMGCQCYTNNCRMRSLFFRLSHPHSFGSSCLKMGIGNMPFPSFTLLLTSDRVVIPGPSYVLRFAPSVPSDLHDPQDAVFLSTTSNNFNEDVEAELASFDYDDSSSDIVFRQTDTDEYLPALSMSTDQTGSSQTTIAGGGLRLKVSLSFLKRRPTARFGLKNIFKRLSPFKGNRD